MGTLEPPPSNENLEKGVKGISPVDAIVLGYGVVEGDGVVEEAGIGEGLDGGGKDGVFELAGLGFHLVEEGFELGEEIGGCEDLDHGGVDGAVVAVLGVEGFGAVEDLEGGDRVFMVFDDLGEIGGGEESGPSDGHELDFNGFEEEEEEEGDGMGMMKEMGGRTERGGGFFGKRARGKFGSWKWKITTRTDPKPFQLTLGGLAYENCRTLQNKQMSFYLKK